MRRVLVFLLLAAMLIGAVCLVTWQLFEPQLQRLLPGPKPTLRVLSYSTFVNSWGPGPALAKKFAAENGIEVVLQDAGDAGLLLKKLRLLPADVVIGLDQLLLEEARQVSRWQPSPTSVALRWQEAEFIPFDWAPLAFVYRQGEIEPPTSLDELLDSRFLGKIAIQDPRLSTPGLQLYYWVLAAKGVEGGLEFLRALKPNLQSVAPSWSSAYGLFQKGQAALAFSYVTSPVYHWTVDNDERYQAAIFDEGHVAQVEYAGVPATCQQCDAAMAFVRFLLRPDSQKAIMEKNFMLPIVSGVEQGTPFARLPAIKLLDMREHAQLQKQREQLLDLWKQLEL